MHDRDAGAAPRLPPARKRLGQHFLQDRRVLARIVEALQLMGTETVVEIGPGQGALTDLLLPRAARVIAIELDRALVPVLRKRYADTPALTIVEADVLDVSLASLGGDGFVVAGNIPYYITTPILFHALVRPRPARAVFLVQREVAERIVAPPGAKAYGALSVNVQAVALPELVSIVARGAFRPAPKVDSAILRLTPRADPVIGAGDELAYRRLVQDAFGQRRKQMRRVLRGVRGVSADEADELLARAGIDPMARPETLSPELFAALLLALGVRG